MNKIEIQKKVEKIRHTLKNLLFDLSALGEKKTRQELEDIIREVESLSFDLEDKPRPKKEETIFEDESVDPLKDIFPPPRDSPHPVNPYAPPTDYPVYPKDNILKCPVCGISCDGAIGYACGRANCPMGGTQARY